MHPTLKWGVKDVGLWLNLFLPQRSVYARQNPNIQLSSNSIYKKGICFNFNDSQCKWPNLCKYRHECAFCAGTHPVAKCFKKMSATNRTNKQNKIRKAFTSVKLQNMLPWLRAIPDKLTAQLLTEGFQDGFLLPLFLGQGCTLLQKLKSVFFQNSFWKYC